MDPWPSASQQVRTVQSSRGTKARKLRITNSHKGTFSEGTVPTPGTWLEIWKYIDNIGYIYIYITILTVPRKSIDHEKNVINYPLLLWDPSRIGGSIKSSQSRGPLKNHGARRFPTQQQHLRSHWGHPTIIKIPFLMGI